MELTAELEALGRVRAPAGFAKRVLAGIDRHAIIESELGELLVTFGPAGITQVRLLEPEDRSRYEIEAELPEEMLGRYDISRLTPFHQAVLRKALEIPRGEVRPYSWIAMQIGHPKAVRAVGSALAKNPIPYFIPCHRVVRSDGVIGNYGMGGPEYKRRILLAEGVNLDGVKMSA